MHIDKFDDFNWLYVPSATKVQKEAGMPKKRSKEEAISGLKHNVPFKSLSNSKRLHEHDLCGYLQEIEPDDWTVVSLPCITTDEEGNRMPDKKTFRLSKVLSECLEELFAMHLLNNLTIQEFQFPNVTIVLKNVTLQRFHIVLQKLL